MFYIGSSAVSSLNLHVRWWHWLILLVWFLTLLLVDLLVVHKKDHVQTIGESVKHTLVWITFGVTLGSLIGLLFGFEAAGQYFNGYLIEKSLSIDNVFTWSVVLTYFTIPKQYQHRVLFWGVFGAIVMRAIFVFAGVALLDRFESVLIIFGLLLIYSAAKFLFMKKEHAFDPTQSRLYRLTQKLIPVSHSLHGHSLFTKENSKRVATKLFMALLVIETIDIVFAVDSVPAILAVSREPFIIIASNASAILGMRALYFVFDGVKNKFTYINHALGILLLFVGVKMFVAPAEVLGRQWFGYHVSTTASLLVIVGIIALGIMASVLFPESNKKK